MEKVYSLEHYYLLEDAEYEDEYEIKSLGIYSSRESAEEAVLRYIKLPGFSKYPIESFRIFESILDEDEAWTEGFVNSIDINKDFEILTKCFIDWLELDIDIQGLWKDEMYYNVLCEIFQIAYSSRDATELSGKIAFRLDGFIGTKGKADYFTLANSILTSLKL